MPYTYITEEQIEQIRVILQRWQYAQFRIMRIFTIGFFVFLLCVLYTIFKRNLGGVVGLVVFVLLAYLQFKWNERAFHRFVQSLTAEDIHLLEGYPNPIFTDTSQEKHRVNYQLDVPSEVQTLVGSILQIHQELKPKESLLRASQITQDITLLNTTVSDDNTSQDTPLCPVQNDESIG